MTRRPGLVEPPRRERVLDMEMLVGWVLLGGLASSIAFILAGLGWYWEATGTLRPSYSLPATDVAMFILTDIRQVALFGAGPQRLINLGIGVLMLTPYTRVLASMVYFAVIDRNPKYALFTAVVLVTLTWSLFR